MIKRLVVAKGWEEGEMSRWITEELYDSETTLHQTLGVDTHHHTFV